MARAGLLNVNHRDDFVKTENNELGHLDFVAIILEPGEQVSLTLNLGDRPT